MIIIDDLLEAINDADFDIDFKGVFTILKAAYTTNGIYKATLVYRSDDNNNPLAKPAVRLLSFNAFLVVLITIYKLTRQEIAPLFALQLFGHYSCFLTFAALAGFGSHPKIKKGKRGDRRIGAAIWTLHGLYAVVLFLGIRWSECVEGNVYPISFLMSDGLFLASYVMLLYAKKRGFDINDLKKDDEDDDVASKEDLELFEAQVAVFFGQQRLLVAWHAMEIILGYVLLNHFFEDAVTCHENNDAWVLHFKAGKMFLLLHTFGVKQSLGVASNVFLKTVKKFEKKHGKGHGAKKKEE